VRTTDLNIQSNNQQGGNKSVFVTLFPISFKKPSHSVLPGTNVSTHRRRWPARPFILRSSASTAAQAALPVQRSSTTRIYSEPLPNPRANGSITSHSQLNVAIIIPARLLGYIKYAEQQVLPPPPPTTLTQQVYHFSRPDGPYTYSPTLLRPPPRRLSTTRPIQGTTHDILQTAMQPPPPTSIHIFDAATHICSQTGKEREKERKKEKSHYRTKRLQVQERPPTLQRIKNT
jgi:hypothetical protein